jgi:hypothetical protein
VATHRPLIRGNHRARARVLPSAAMRTTRAWIAVLALAGCRDRGGENAPTGDGPDCVGAKCDDLDSDSGADTAGDTADVPSDPVAASCERRRDDAFNPNELAFTSSALRWSCDDVEEVEASARGQEYCEYFAIVQLPGGSEPAVLGRNLGAEPEDGQTPIPLQLDGDDIAQLEADPEAITGECVFTSWNADEDAPACAGDACDETVLGVPVDADTFRMKFDVNSTEAAVGIITDCLELLPPEGDPADPGDPLHDDFQRACRLNADVNMTEWRKSDNVICGATLRLAECGCTLEGTTSDFPDVLPLQSSLGFPLGTWSGITDLPGGCRYVDPGDGSRHIVACDLTALEVLDNAAELKAYCAEKYGPNVVVHVPIDASAIQCEPPLGEPYAATCDAEPWVLAGDSP